MPGTEPLVYPRWALPEPGPLAVGFGSWFGPGMEAEVRVETDGEGDEDEDEAALATETEIDEES